MSSPSFPDTLAGKRVHFIGAKGTGMAALAEIIAAKGAILSGSDVPDTFYTDAILRSLRMRLDESFDAAHIDGAIDLVVYSDAYSAATNSEMAEAAGRGLPMFSFAQALGALSRMTAHAVDQGEKPAVPSAIAKYHATELGREVVKDAMDIHAGKGVILGPRNYLGRAWQGAPISITVEGANILTRSMIVFGQGAVRCHPFVLKEMRAAALADPVQRLDEFDRLLWGHVGFAVSNAVRALALGLVHARFGATPADGYTAKFYRKLTRYSATLALVADTAMLTLGGKLKQKERLSARLGDVLSALYIGSAMLKRYEDQGRPAADQPLLAWAMHDQIHRIQLALDGVLRNFPIRPVAWLLRVLVFPLGLREKAPGDRLGHRVASAMMTPSETRGRLAGGIYDGEGPRHPVGQRSN